MGSQMVGGLGPADEGLEKIRRVTAGGEGVPGD